MDEIYLEKILPNPEQPRKTFHQSELESLALSIKQNGVLQPVLLEEASDGMFIILDGERRWRAAKMAGLKQIPAMIFPPTNGNGGKERLIKAIVANMQRSNLNSVEEARVYQKLRSEGNLTIREISIKTGIYESRISNALLILQLDKPIQDLIEQGKFSHLPDMINLLLDIPDSKVRIDLSQKLSNRGLGKNGRAIRNSVSLIIKKMQSELPYKEDQTPALEEALRDKPADLPKWDILFQLGKVPSWSIVYASAMATCNTCPRRPAASESTCEKCVGVNMLRNLIEFGNKEKAHILAQRVFSTRAKVNGHR